jgi:hypothetical protein
MRVEHFKIGFGSNRNVSLNGPTLFFFRAYHRVKPQATNSEIHKFYFATKGLEFLFCSGGPIPASAYRVPTECLAINMHPGIIRVSSLMHCSCIRHAMVMHGVQMLVRCCIDVVHSSLHPRDRFAWHSVRTLWAYAGDWVCSFLFCVQVLNKTPNVKLPM